MQRIAPPAATVAPPRRRPPRPPPPHPSTAPSAAAAPRALCLRRAGAVGAEHRTQRPRGRAVPQLPSSRRARIRTAARALPASILSRAAARPRGCGPGPGRIEARQRGGALDAVCSEDRRRRRRGPNHAAAAVISAAVSAAAAAAGCASAATAVSAAAAADSTAANAADGGGRGRRHAPAARDEADLNRAARAWSADGRRAAAAARASRTAGGEFASGGRGGRGGGQDVEVRGYQAEALLWQGDPGLPRPAPPRANAVNAADRPPAESERCARAAR
jgi:hypothetical protein